MIDLSPEVLDQECALYTRYLTGGEATDAIRAAYRRGHEHIPFHTDADPSARPIDAWILGLSRRGAFGARAADAYSRFFRAGGILRQKLTLVLAIVEHGPPHHRSLNRGGGSGPVGAFFGLGMIGIGFAAALATGILLLGPAHLIGRNRG